MFEKNVSVPRKGNLPIRCNVYRPLALEGARSPVLVTYGPYGKDIPCDTSELCSSIFPRPDLIFNADSTQNLSVKSIPNTSRNIVHGKLQILYVYWTKEGYVIVRADEQGLGQSPGILDTISKGTSECLFDVVKWAAVQQWSSGKVGLLGNAQREVL